MADECVLLLAPLGVVHQAGGDARRLLGVEPRRLIGVGIGDLVRPADRKALFESMRNAVLRRTPGTVRCAPAIRTPVSAVDFELVPRFGGSGVESWVVRAREAAGAPPAAAPAPADAVAPAVEHVDVGDASGLRSWAIQRGLRAGEFDLDLQPIVSVSDRETVGYEALVRWTRPGLGRVPASQFLPAVEEAGLMSELGLRVLDLAVQRLSLWSVTNPTRELSVNVSPTELLRPGFVEDVASIVQNGRIDPRRLTLEFAFKPIKADQAELSHVMQRLHKVAGVKLAIDDYAAPGMYSPANVLPVDVLKFDRSITDAITRSPDHRVLLGSLVALVRSAGREVVATGVESDAQIHAVAGIGIEYAQGYLLGLPEPVDPSAAAAARSAAAAAPSPAPTALPAPPPLSPLRPPRAVPLPRTTPERIVAGPVRPTAPAAPRRRPTWPPPEPVPVAPAARAPQPTVPPPPATPRPGVPLPSWPVVPAATAPAPDPAPSPAPDPEPAVAEVDPSPISGLRLVPNDATGRGLVFERPDGRWSFRVIGPDGEPVAEGAARGYPSRGEARRVVEQLLGGAFDGPVEDLR